MQRLLLSLISLAPLLLAGAIWNLSIESQQQRPEPDVGQADLPEVIISSAEFNQYGEDGSLTQQLTTERAVSYRGGEEIRLSRPQLQATSATQRWTASSQEGLLDRPGSALQLLGQVQLQRLGNAPIELRTESLTWLPTQSSAFTNEEVVVESPGSRIQSTGITIDLDSSSFLLHSSVRGSHELL